MNKLSILLATLFAICCFTSCDKEAEQEKYPDFARMISVENITVTPKILETIGGKIPVTINIAVPAHFTYPTASVSLLGSLEWDGGKFHSQPGGFQGTELPDMGNTIIPYETGGNVMVKYSFDYVPEMAKSELFLEFDVLYLDRHTTFHIKIADGVTYLL